MIDDRQNIADFPSGLRATLPNNRAENKQLSLAMILHDLRAPMTTIMLALSHLQRLELPKESQRQIFLALSEAQRFRVTLDETLLFFSASKLQLCPLELNGAIEETLNLIPSIPDAKGREIRWVPTCGQVWLRGDRNKLKQVFINLLTNACQAVKPGEVITWSVELDSTSKHVSIRLHNGGNPIAPEVLSQLTKPFFTTKPNGTGLGLAIVDEIVRAHSGEMKIESSTTFGTTVSVRLPLLRQS
ncbi:MAG: ATP-binding protein [Prochloraceae cyanobacterium]|nr:ATP-binding protein [Prochloraceae cyanobacterium]